MMQPKLIRPNGCWNGCASHSTRRFPLNHPGGSAGFGVARDRNECKSWLVNIKRWPALLETLPWGTRTLVLVLVSLQLAAFLGEIFHWISLAAWLGLTPAQVWQGKIWPLLTHAYLPGGWMDLILNGFVLVMISLTLERFWSGRELLLYTGICAVAGGIVTVLVFSGSREVMLGLQNLLMSLLVAWGRLLGHERVTLWGSLDLSVIQVVLGLGFLLGLLTFMSLGRFGLVALAAAGGSGWLYFFMRWRWMMSSASQAASTDRMRKLEL